MQKYNYYNINLFINSIMAKDLKKQMKSLCAPAMIYFVISMISIIFMLLQNMGSSGVYTIGKYSRPCGNVALVFLGKLIYVFFWTWVLNFLCKRGYSSISWFLVLLPFLFFFVILGMFLLGSVEKGLYN